MSLQYQREFEQEADYAGARYLQSAGYAATKGSSIQPAGRRGSADVRMTASNSVSTRISKRRHDRRSECDTRNRSSGMTPLWIG